MDEARARAFLLGSRKPEGEWVHYAEFRPDPKDRTSADIVTVSFCPGSDCLSAQVAWWAWSDVVKARFPVDDPKGREVITRHVGAGGALGLVGPSSVLSQRFVLYSSGQCSRFDNAPWDVREQLTPEQKEAWRLLAKDFAGRGQGAYELLDRPDVGESVLVHTGPYANTLEVAFFSKDPARVRKFSWDTKERRARLNLVGQASASGVDKLGDAALVACHDFSAHTSAGPPPVEAMALTKSQHLLP